MAALADIRDIMRGALSSLFGFGGRLVARTMLMVIAGRWFGMSELGVLGQVAAITEITAAIAVLGLKRSLLDMLSYRQEHNLPVEKRVVEALILSTGAAFILSGLLFFAWPVFIPEISALRTLLFFAVPAIVFTEVALSAIKFKRVIKWDVLSRGFTEPWGFLLLAIIIYNLGLVSTGLVVAYVGSVLISALTVGIGLVKTYGLSPLLRANPSMKDVIAIPRQSTPTGITDLGVMMLRRVDILVLGLFVPAAGTGLYYMVQQFATIPQKVNGLFEPMTSPVLARLHNQFNTGRIRASLLSICRWIFIIQVAISVPMIVYGDNILALFGPTFAIGGICLTLILIAELIDGSFITTETALLYAYPKIPPLILFVGLVIEIAAIAILSYIWGVNGAALGFLVAIVVITIARLVMLKRKMGINVVSPTYLPPIGFALLMAVCLYSLKKWLGSEHAVLIIISIVAILVGYAYLIRAFTLLKSDRILWRAFTHKKPNALKKPNTKTRVMMKTFAQFWAKTVYKHALIILILSGFLTGLAFHKAKSISVNTNLEALMPQGAESVKTLNDALRKTGSFASIQIVIHSDNPETTLKSVKDAKDRIDKYDWVASSQYYEDVGVLEKHKLLLLSFDNLLVLEEKLDKNYPKILAHEVAKRIGSDVIITLRNENVIGNSSEEFDEDILEQLNGFSGSEPISKRFFMSKDKLTTVLVVWPKPGLGSLSSAKAMVEDAHDVAAEVLQDNISDNLQVGVAGRIANKVAQFDAIVGDVKFGLLGSISLIALLIIFSYRSFVAIPSIFIPLIIGIVWTLGVTAMTIGGLNLITIFLTLILFGLGIDFGIHNFSRYREERRDGKSIEHAIEIMITDTGSASFIAALTTSVGFYALMLTDFRAFTEFGFIAGTGVILIYISMYSVFPALVVILEKLGIWRTEKPGRRLLTRLKLPKRQRRDYNKIIFAVAGSLFLFSVFFAPKVAFERNFKNLEAEQPQSLQAANERVRNVFPDGHDRAIIVVPSLDELTALDQYFKRKIFEDTDTPTIKKVSSILDFLPNQEAQRKRHEVIRRIQKRAELLKNIDREKYNAAEHYLSIDDLNLSDMPQAIKRTYIGMDSEPGYLMYVYNSVSMDDSADARRYYDDAANVVVNGKTYHSASEGFIFVEMLALMKADAVKAISLVVIFTALSIFLFLRSFSASLVVLIPPLLGVLLTVGIMGAFGPKLSIMNMVILPSLIGISVDNSIHIFHRFKSEGRNADIAKIMNNTGRAAVLTTLTTLLGFGGMVTASMGGLRSMGLLAIIGFVACLAITWTLLPALLSFYSAWMKKTGGRNGEN